MMCLLKWTIFDSNVREVDVKYSIQYLLISFSMIHWLVVLTILKNISQWEGLSHILWKIKNVPNHQSVHHSKKTISPMKSHWNSQKFPDVPKFSAPLRLTAFSKDGARQDSGRGSAIPCHVVRLAGNLGKKFMMRWTAAKCWVNVGLSQKIWGYHRIVWGKHLEPGWKMRIRPPKNRDLTISSGDAKWIWLCLTWL